MRVTSSSSDVSCSRRMVLPSMRRRLWSTISGGTARLRSAARRRAWALRRREARGVRSSWEAMRRNSSRCWSARRVSASSRALSRASAMRRPSSAASSSSARASRPGGTARGERQRADRRVADVERHDDRAPRAELVDELGVALVDAAGAELVLAEDGQLGRRRPAAAAPSRGWWRRGAAGSAPISSRSSGSRAGSRCAPARGDHRARAPRGSSTAQSTNEPAHSRVSTAERSPWSSAWDMRAVTAPSRSWRRSAASASRRRARSRSSRRAFSREIAA